MQHSLAECEAVIGYRFRDSAYLISALTHSSAKSDECEGNERLEFLGDAVLGLIISRELYDRFPDSHEGELTRIKSAVVSRATLADRAHALGLAAYMKLGKGLALKAKIPTSVLANIFEAIVAAIFIDGGAEGYDAAKRFVLDTLTPTIDEVADHRHQRNYKSMLQQVAQRRLAVTPQYRVMGERGPDHGKSFEVAAVVGGRKFDSAWGRSKKDAEQRAASLALDTLADEMPSDEIINSILSGQS